MGPHDELLRSPSDLPPSPLRPEILIPPPSSLVPELLPSESLDLEPVSELCSVPSSSVTPETHPSRLSSSPTPFLDSPSPKPWVSSFDGCLPHPLRFVNSLLCVKKIPVRTHAPLSDAKKNLSFPVPTIIY